MTPPSSPSISPALIEAALDAADAEERRQATSLAAELPLYDALPLLVRALGDTDWRVRKEATYAARAFIPAPSLIAAMVKTFEPCDNVGLRNASIEVLANCGSAATAPLEASLARLDADGRKLAVQALGYTRDPHALVILERSLRDLDENVRQGAVEAIAQLGPIAPVEVQRLLFRCLDSADPFAKLAALEGLNALGAMIPWERLAPLLEHPSLRSAALSAAAASESPAAAPALARMLHKARGGTFMLAIAALARLAEGPLLPAVTEALAAEGPELGERLVRVATAEGTDPPHHRAMALLLAAVARAPGVVDAAAAALAEETFTEQAERALFLLGPAALPGLVARIAPEQGTTPLTADVRAALIEVAASIALAPGAPERPTALLEALRKAALDDERRVATSALFALSRLGTEEDLALAARLVASPVRPVAHAAEGALASLATRHEKAARALGDTLVNGPGDDAFAAAIILGALAATRRASSPPPSPGDLGFLARAAAAEDVRTRRAAIGAVAEIGGDSALDVLSLALADEEREVQLAAARALGYLGAAARRRETSPDAHEAPSLRTILDVAGRSMDAELVATAIRALGEALSTIPPEAAGRAAASLIDALAPLARQAEAAVAIAAAEAIGRLRWGTSGRQAALVAALDHPDAAVVKAALLKVETSGPDGEVLLRLLDHPSPDVRLLAAETIAASDNSTLRERLAQRASLELDRDVRDTLEGALSSIRWRGERGFFGP
ncbi:HEAT repeat domain-containing protein [Polyangium mundeleinium]|uniref:HEAT repeat domain-containing protein n=1 Tax=Polyangium mundeleinium TaxID=2995306 RepID=A0ABT5EI14_9BACT|nr:HEAT repeat domain-containing protein [Polyangium mundeleinium]MDC0741455.1 HEAT repeat domain-containing protein [Polyangium mundeleinium]